MSAPSSSFEMDSLGTKSAIVSADTVLLKDSEDSNLLKQTSVGDLETIFTWAATDEDSPLSTGIQYVTEPATVQRIISEIVISLKNAPTTAGGIEVDIFEETAVNSNIFTTSLFSTKPTIDQNEFTSQTADIPPVLQFGIIWNLERRLQIVLTINDDPNFAATGLKVTLR